MHELNGETEPSGTTAIFSGSLWGEAAAALHESMDWSDESIDNAIRVGSDKVCQDYQDEGRTPSDVVMRDLKDLKTGILSEIATSLSRYRDRYADKFSTCELIGTEVPINYTISHPLIQGGSMLIKSHLDLLFRDTEGVFGKGKDTLWFWDWKRRMSSPEWFLPRHQQFLAYWLGLKYGKIEVNGMWISLDEWSEGGWLHVPYLEPYKRGGTRKDGTTFNKGDMRGRVLWLCNYVPQNEESARMEIAMKIRRMQEGLWEMNPGDHCQFCEAKTFCFRADMERIGAS